MRKSETSAGRPRRLRLTLVAALVSASSVLLHALLQANPQSGAPAGQTPAMQFQQAVTLMESRNDLAGAIRLFENVAAGSDRRLAAHAILNIAICYERLGKVEAERKYREVIAKFPDQAKVAQQAVERLAALNRPAAKGASPKTHRPVWPDMRGEPTSVSLDGRVVAFVNGLEFILLNPSTEMPGPKVPIKQGRDDPGAIYPGVVLSPNGEEAAFSFERSDGSSELRAVRLETGDWRVLARAGSKEWIAPIEWRSSSRLLVSRRHSNGNTDLIIVSAATGVSRTVVELSASPQGASLSPDGLFIVYDAPETPDGATRDIFISSIGDGLTRQLVSGPADDVSPLWTGDGGRIIFLSDRTGTQGIWTVAMQNGVASGPIEMSYQDPGLVGQPLGLTSAGQYFYLRQTGLVDVYRVDLDPTGMPLSPPVNGAQRFRGTNMGAAWSPDNRLTFLSRLGYTFTDLLTVHDPERDVERVIDTGLRGVRNIRWSPAGDALLLRATDADRRYGIYVFNPLSRQVAPVRTVPPSDESFLGPTAWSRDGTSVLYVWRQGDASRLVSRSIGTGVEQTIVQTAPRSGINSFDVSRNTGAIAYVEVSESGFTLKVADANGGTRVVVQEGADTVLQSPSWLPDGRALLIVRAPRGPGRQSDPAVWRIDVTGAAPPKPLNISMPALRNLDVTDDGSSLTFTAGAPLREPYVLENFLPRSNALVRRAPSRRPL